MLPDVIVRAVWLYARFLLARRRTEDLLAEGSIFVLHQPCQSVRREKSALCAVTCEVDVAAAGFVQQGPLPPEMTHM
ncbi:hypothetical protein SUH3_22530 [Pseudosulfitobacter pseudonitzschiae]|uniref:Uncharacterized protein n=1 Tax=Pseudosulfitobacter pseudonitzschiae TaxID=1402135 RepID=A0A073J0A3_9RHOB|nr:hypothetical protein SUH3_22530 [Pseudosulfitobacter pseudonitzschiae]